MAAITNLSTVKPLLTAELKRRFAFRTRVNHIHLQRLDAIGGAGSNRMVSTEPLTHLETTRECGLEPSVDEDTLGDDIELQLTTFTDFMLAIKD